MKKNAFIIVDFISFSRYIDLQNFNFNLFFSPAPYQSLLYLLLLPHKNIILKPVDPRPQLPQSTTHQSSLIVRYLFPGNPLFHFSSTLNYILFLLAGLFPQRTEIILHSPTCGKIFSWSGNPLGSASRITRCCMPVCIGYFPVSRADLLGVHMAET